MLYGVYASSLAMGPKKKPTAPHVLGPSHENGTGGQTTRLHMLILILTHVRREGDH